MILRLEQKNIYIRNNYQLFSVESEPVASINIRNNTTLKQDFDITLQDGSYINCYFSYVRNKYVKGFGKSVVTTVLLNKENKVIGKIVLKTSKNKGLKYYYNEIEFNSNHYTSYEIGMGADGYYIMLYKDNQPVGAISKDSVIYLNRDTYSIYCTEDTEVQALLIALTIMWDAKASEGIANSVHDGEVATKRVELIYSPQKELLEKFNPNFISEIKSQAGLTDEE